MWSASYRISAMGKTIAGLRYVSAGSAPDVAAQAESLRFRAGVADEKGAGNGRERERERDGLVMALENKRDCAENSAFADAVGRRVEERAERRRLPAGAREGVRRVIDRDASVRAPLV